MPYESGETPVVGDKVRHINGGRPGVVTNVQLEQGHLQGADQVSVKWDDGGPGLGAALADEFTLVERPNFSVVSKCPECQTPRSVDLNRIEVESNLKTGAPINGCSAICGHFWAISNDERKNLEKTLREQFV